MKNRSPEGDIECVLCGRRCFSFTKYPVCYDCVFHMYRVAERTPWEQSTRWTDWYKEELLPPEN